MAITADNRMADGLKLVSGMAGIPYVWGNVLLMYTNFGSQVKSNGFFSEVCFRRAVAPERYY